MDIIARWIGGFLASKAITLALIAAVAGGGWYVKHLYDSRLLERQVTENWKKAAEGWSDQYVKEKARVEALDVLRLRRERERDQLAGQVRDITAQLSALERSDPDVRAWDAQQLPPALDAEMNRLEAAVGAKP